VRSLQFEDIATQALGAATTHLDRLSAINREATALHQLLHNADRADAEVRQALAQLGPRNAQKKADWERPPHKAVMQQSMDAGSVELF
jgi:methyl-accepting chemotaxis protein